MKRALAAAVAAAALLASRVSADDSWDPLRTLLYARLGGGTVAGAGAAIYPAVGLGFRAERRRLGIDLSAANLVLPTSFDNRRAEPAPIDGSFAPLLGLCTLGSQRGDT